MIHSHSRWCTSIVAAIALSGAAHADILNIVASIDNTLYESATGALSSGVGPTAFVGKTGTGLIRRALFQFDLSGIPAGATINVVTLSLNMSMTSGGATNVAALRLNSHWGEGTSNAGVNGGAGAAATTGDATWLHTFFNTSTWSSAGGDFAGVASATTSVNAIGNYTWSSAQMLSDVQSWIAAPSNNFGWAMLGDEVNNNSSKRFDTRENATAGNRPTLIINYTPVPAPASLTALLGGLLTRGSRRRRG